MTRGMTVTLALILGGSLTAGIALARPASSGGTGAGVDDPLRSVPVARPDGRAGYLDRGRDQDEGAGAEVVIRDFSFGPPQTVGPGTSVTVANADGVAHTATFDGAAIDTGSIAGGASTVFASPATPGTYSFFCAIHPSMRGEIVVR